MFFSLFILILQLTYPYHNVISLEIHMVIFYSQKRIQLTQQQKILLEREYGGGSVFEFRAKMTVVKKTANKRLVFYNPL